MWNIPDSKRLENIPWLYETEHVPLQAKTVYLHFFIGGCDWYICEFDGAETFWGYCILNGDLLNAEWGYIPFDELKSVNVSGIEIDNDLYWKARPAIDVDKIRKGMGWEPPPGKEEHAAVQ